MDLMIRDLIVAPLVVKIIVACFFAYAIFGLVYHMRKA